MQKTRAKINISDDGSLMWYYFWGSSRGNEAHTLIKLKLSVDTHFSSVMDYFEIFMERMRLCRKAAEKLGLKFKLMINEQQLI